MTHRSDIAAAGGDPTDRLSADDQATQREAQFLAMSLAQQAERAASSHARPGTCSFCGAMCLPRAVYCDADCREDHEHELTIRARQGVRR